MPACYKEYRTPVVSISAINRIPCSLNIKYHYRLVKKYISSLKILLDKGFRDSKFQTI